MAVTNVLGPAWRTEYHRRGTAAGAIAHQGQTLAIPLDTLETSLRYQESKEQSAELLRKVLALMGQHDAAFNPVSFTVWYEFAAGMNVQLAQALAQAMKTEPRLSTATVFQLYSQHVADAGPGAIQHIAGELQRMMASMADNASSTSERAGAFGAQLAGLTQALSTQDASLLTPQVSEALAGTALMRTSAQALVQQIMDSRQEIERLQSELTRVRDEVLMDPLTKVLNRRGFDQQMARLLAEPAVPGCEHCLVLLDIDHFKKVNDTHGHVMGDRVIQALGEVLRACVPDKAHSVARYGGEEFAILLPNCSLNHGIKVADTVRQRTRAMKIRDRKTQEVVLTVSISGGVATLRPGDDASALIARADGALYQAKQSGRDCVSHA
jgi:diguanylate cyclase